MKNALIVENLNKSFQVSAFKKKQVLNNITFSIPSGEITGFIGSNGSGKTTSIKCILQFIFPDSGKILFFDHEELSLKVKNKIGFLPERPYIPDYLSVKEFLKMHWNLAKGGNGFEERSIEVIKKVDLSHALDRPLRAFSKGMQQRAAIAQAILMKPDLIILDEPMTGLDPDGRLIVKEIIKDEQKKGTSIFFSSHLLNDMDELCSYIVMVDKGNLKFQGKIEKFYGNQIEDFELLYRDKEGKFVQLNLKSNLVNEKLKQLINENCEIVKVEKIHQTVESAYSQLRG